MSSIVSNGPPVTEIRIEKSIENSDYDSFVSVLPPHANTIFQKYLDQQSRIDSAFYTQVSVLPVSESDSSKRLIYSPAGPIDPDYDDVRLFKESAAKAVARAMKAGSKRPLLVLENDDYFKNGQLCTLLGALEELYTPIQAREYAPSLSNKVDYLGVWTGNVTTTEKLANIAQVLENGRRVACDIGGADPERMAPPKVEAYIRSLFSNTSIGIEVISDPQQLKQEYPLFEAVNRAASCQERHRGRIIILEYQPPEEVHETLFLVGKGVTYDTGGADVKINGSMLGMSRDKCGAAAVVGFMQIVATLKPKNLKVVGGVGIVRNSVGSNSYVADEIITARSGARVRVTNTDAEGRMIMADLLCRFKEEAINAVNPHLFTIATLTGHACLTAGMGYSIVIDNGPAKKAGLSQKLQDAGNAIGDPFEISTLRKEDIAGHKCSMEGVDFHQGNNKPSTQTMRGHQGPMGFLLLTSGLDKYGSESKKPIKYSHLEIAASAGELPKKATGSSVLALAQHFLL